MGRHSLGKADRVMEIYLKGNVTRKIVYKNLITVPILVIELIQFTLPSFAYCFMKLYSLTLITFPYMACFIASLYNLGSNFFQIASTRKTIKQIQTCQFR